MTTTVLPRVTYLNVSHGVVSWLLTRDHKRIGVMYLVVVPVVPAVLGNFVMPLMIGAKDVAFPTLNLMSWYIFVIGFLFTVAAMVTGGVDTGWTFYTPYSSTASNSNVVMILATPVIAITVAMMALERALGFGIFDPRLGGDPVLFQHLFWFYSHPAVYIMILPPMGVISEVIACFSRKNIFGYSFVAFSSLAIAIFGFLVWGHHLFVAGISPYSAMVFSFLSFAVAIPSAVKTFNWTATLYKGAIWWRAPMMYVVGFIGLFLIGGLTGLLLASLGLDVHLHDTYFVVAHFHYIMVGGAIMGFFAGLHYWWPKMTGRMFSNAAATLAALLVFVGFNLTFFPQFILGYLGMPRRYHMYPPEFQVLNVLSTAGATVLGVGYVFPMVYFAWSWRYGKPAGNNP